MNKNGKSIAAILGLALSAALPLAAHAQAATPGIYVGTSLGQSEVNNYTTCDPRPDCKKKGTAWKFYSGWQFHRNFAAEFGYTDLGRVSSSVPGTLDEAIKVKLGELTLVGSLPATERFSLFAKGGVYYANTVDDLTVNGATSHLTQTNASLTYGLGVQYFVYGGLGVRGELQRYLKVGGGNIGSKFDYQLITAGVVWKFR